LLLWVDLITNMIFAARRTLGGAGGKKPTIFYFLHTFFNRFRTSQRHVYTYEYAPMNNGTRGIFITAEQPSV